MCTVTITLLYKNGLKCICAIRDDYLISELPAESTGLVTLTSVVQVEAQTSFLKIILKFGHEAFNEEKRISIIIVNNFLIRILNILFIFFHIKNYRQFAYII